MGGSPWPFRVDAEVRRIPPLRKGSARMGHPLLRVRCADVELFRFVKSTLAYRMRTAGALVG
jgi:hypothetical protein